MTSFPIGLNNIIPIKYNYKKKMIFFKNFKNLFTREDIKYNLDFFM